MESWKHWFACRLEVPAERIWLQSWSRVQRCDDACCYRVVVKERGSVFVHEKGRWHEKVLPSWITVKDIPRYFAEKSRYTTFICSRGKKVRVEKQRRKVLRRREKKAHRCIYVPASTAASLWGTSHGILKLSGSTWNPKHSHARN